MGTGKDDYYSVARRKQVREESRKLRKKYLSYKEAEIVYSFQHKKLLELADDAGATIRIGRIVMIDTEILDKYIDSFRDA